jgi:hypothetical protein
VPATPDDLYARFDALGIVHTTTKHRPVFTVEEGADRSVTLFALINDPERKVRLILDEGFFAYDLVNFHPLGNDATTAISPADMLKFARAASHEPVRLAFDAAGQPSLIERKP